MPATGDDTPATSLAGYVRRMSGRHQLGLFGLAILVSLMDLVPVELQRRMIDDAVTPGDAELLVTLALIYAAALVIHQGLKFALRMYQGWVSESAIRYTREHSLSVRARREPEEPGGNAGLVLGSEIDKLGSFVGEGPSGAVANVALLLGVLGYMLAVEPFIALFAIAFLIPQALVAPLLQRRLNRLVNRRVRLIRRLSEEVQDPDLDRKRQLRALPFIYRNRILYFGVKHGMKGLLNLMNGLAPLTVLAVGGWMAIQGETTVGVLVAFLSGFQRIADPVRKLIGFYRQWEQTRVQHDLVASWMQRTNED